MGFCERGSACRRYPAQTITPPRSDIKIESATGRKPMMHVTRSRETAFRTAWYIEQHDPRKATAHEADERDEKCDQCLLSGGWAGRCMRGERLPYWLRAAAMPCRAGPALPRFFKLQLPSSLHHLTTSWSCLASRCCWIHGPASHPHGLSPAVPRGPQGCEVLGTAAPCPPLESAVRLQVGQPRRLRQQQDSADRPVP